MSGELTICDLNRNQKIALWSEQIKECRNSGKPARIWCKENGIAASTYYHHQRYVLKYLQNGSEDKICAKENETQFAEIAIQPETPALCEQNQSCLQAVVANIQTGRISVSIYSGAKATVVKALCEGLQHAE